MIQKIKTYMLVLASAFMMGVPMLLPAAASAACSNIGNKVVEGVNAAAGSGEVACTTTNTSGGDLAKIASTLVNIFSIVVGAVAVIMIIYGGFRYITSGGDSGRVGNAKSTLLYAVIGLIVVALSQLIVHFVIGQSSTIAQ